MITSQVLGSLLTIFVAATPALQIAPPQAPSPHVLASEVYSLTDRYTNEFVNNVFSENILLTLSYMDGQTIPGEKVDWDKVNQPAEYAFVLKPGEAFAFHNLILDQYKNSVVKTTNADFSSDQGFKSDGWLVGDGVCHFASFINVVASEAGLGVDAPTPHDFAKIADVDKKHGTAIYYVANEPEVSKKQNLYITNTLDKPITFVFKHEGNTFTVTVEEE